MSIPDNTVKAFEFAQEATKQVITLSTGLLALSITFLDDIIGDSPGDWGVALLRGSWFAYLVSVVFGLLTLLALSGNLVRPNDGSTPDPYAKGIVIPSIVQLATFGVGLVLTLLVGLTAS